jgi:CDP-diacylglycerol--glycerol-3-phosphate 3-phosphatidyltransferase
MVVVSVLGIIGAFLTSYTRARAESLGIDAKVGLMQRPERVVLLSAPQAFFGLTLEGYVLMFIVTLLTVTSWITAAQRMVFVYRVTLPIDRGLTPAEVVPAALVRAPRGPGAPS